MLQRLHFCDKMYQCFFYPTTAYQPGFITRQQHSACSTLIAENLELIVVFRLKQRIELGPIFVNSERSKKNVVQNSLSFSKCIQPEIGLADIGKAILGWVVLCFLAAKKETKKKLPPAFANLFAKAAKKTKSDDVSITSVEKAGGKKEKMDKRKENTSTPTCQSDDFTIVEKAGVKKEKMDKRKDNKGAVNKKPTSGNEGIILLKRYIVCVCKRQGSR